MDVTTMPSIPLLLDTLVQDYPSLTFKSGDQFEWHPPTATITYDLTDPDFEAHLLHEVSHAQLKHAGYDRDIDLIAMERDAWQYARSELSPHYGVPVVSELIHHDMDTYRDWLHRRSTCPYCDSTGLQLKKREYRCLTCKKPWRVNEARSCQLRRYRLL